MNADCPITPGMALEGGAEFRGVLRAHAKQLERRRFQISATTADGKPVGTCTGWGRVIGDQFIVESVDQ